MTAKRTAVVIVSRVPPDTSSMPRAPGPPFTALCDTPEDRQRALYDALTTASFSAPRRKIGGRPTREPSPDHGSTR